MGCASTIAEAPGGEGLRRSSAPCDMSRCIGCAVGPQSCWAAKVRRPARQRRSASTEAAYRRGVPPSRSAASVLHIGIRAMYLPKGTLLDG